tara:strand:+ start:706 stop:1113 length:408 start_codon:yes stop_codon:yes gene_type:complete
MTTITNAPALISTLEGALRTISILEARVKELEEGSKFGEENYDEEDDLGPDPVWIEKLNNLREKYEQEICSCATPPWIHMDHVSRPCEGFPNTCGDCEKFVPPEVRGAGGVPEEEPHCEKCLFFETISEGVVIDE